jgi:hypothetical protein
MSLRVRKEPRILVGMHRRLEVWRPINKLTPAQMKDAKAFRIFGGVEKALIDVDERELDFEDLVVDGGLQAACECTFKSASRPAVFDYVAIGTDGTAPAAGQTTLLAESMRVQGTYANDATDGECSMDATFDITQTLALQECGLFNDPTTGTMYGRDTYTTKNVESGDTVKVYYTPKFQRPA